MPPDAAPQDTVAQPVGLCVLHSVHEHRIVEDGPPALVKRRPVREGVLHVASCQLHLPPVNLPVRHKPQRLLQPPQVEHNVAQRARVRRVAAARPLPPRQGVEQPPLVVDKVLVVVVGLRVDVLEGVPRVDLEHIVEGLLGHLPVARLPHRRPEVEVDVGVLGVALHGHHETLHRLLPRLVVEQQLGVVVVEAVVVRRGRQALLEHELGLAHRAGCL
mmetsp:Transcript_5438/g.13163  ORF Transcript_5438/g.13163 Transcript_5438/m.13163 type:complete len:217 (-) Transcript_5438:293-943(-)